MYNIPSEINSETKIFKNIYLIDMIILLVSLLLTIVFSNIVSSKVVMIYYVFSIGLTVFFISKSSTNPGIRNYKAIYLMMIRNRKVYKSIDWNTERGI